MSKNKTFSKLDSCLLVVLVLLLSLSAAALAQPAAATTQTGNVSTATPPANNGVAKPASPAAQPINKGQAVYLVRSTLMMLNDANRSGNYTVLRDLAAPEFQSRNSAADLAQSFLDLRRRKFDLFAVSFAPPQFTSEPSLDASGKVRLMGFFATQPLQINFDLTFQSVGGEWKLLAISVATPPAPKQQSSLAPPSSPTSPTRKAFYNVRLFSGIAGFRW
jgi:hypothetical protein